MQNTTNYLTPSNIYVLPNHSSDDSQVKRSEINNSIQNLSVTVLEHSIEPMKSCLTWKSRTTHLPCPYESFRRKDISLNHFTRCIREHRGFDIRPPEKGDNLHVYFSTMPGFKGYMEFGAMDFEKLIKESGELKSKFLSVFVLSLTGSNIICGHIEMKRESNNEYKINTLFIDKHYKNQYLGSLLLAFAAKKAHQENCSRITLFSSVEGIIPYLRFGFSPDFSNVEYDDEPIKKKTIYNAYAEAKELLLHPYTKEEMFPILSFEDKRSDVWTQVEKVWDKIPDVVREKILMSSKNRCFELKLDNFRVKHKMEEQLFRALFFEKLSCMSLTQN